MAISDKFSHQLIQYDQKSLTLGHFLKKCRMLYNITDGEYLHIMSHDVCTLCRASDHGFSKLNIENCAVLLMKQL